MNIKLFSSEEAAKFLGITRQGLAAAVKKGYLRPVEVLEIPRVDPHNVTIVSSHKFFTEEVLRKYEKSGKRRYRK